MAQIEVTGPVWVIRLNHTETLTAEAIVGAASAVIKQANLPAPIGVVKDLVAIVLGIGSAYIASMDTIGGNNGVDINGVIGVQGVIITPHLSGFFETLAQGARVVVAAEATITDFILKASGEIPGIGGAMGVTTAAAVFAAVESGSPLGWALAGAARLVVKLFESEPNPNQHGGVHADRTAISNWETFILALLPTGKHSLLSWQGLFSADNGGGSGVYANRAKIGPWETWTMLDNKDGTYSFQSVNGHYLTALNGGGNGSTCYSDRTAIGAWERFYVQPLQGGHVALKTHDKGTYVSVQSGL